MISSAEEFGQLRMSDCEDEQRRARHESAEEAVWRSVIADYPELKVWVVRNKTVPIEILRLLATDVDPRVRREVAAKRKLDHALFAALAKDSNEIVRRAVTLNANCPAEFRKSPPLRVVR